MFVNILLICSFSFGETKYRRDIDLENEDADTTYVSISQSHSYVARGELLVMGDSYAVLLARYSDKKFNYIVHQGYSVYEMLYYFFRLLDAGSSDTFKYVYVFIGGNDFMNQTDLRDFKDIMQEIIDNIKKRGATPIFSNYIEPDLNQKTGLRLLKNKCSYYDAIIKKLTYENNCLYVDIEDLWNYYGTIDNDFIHPNAAFYSPVVNRVEKRIIDDKSDKGSPSYDEDFKKRKLEFMRKYKNEIDLADSILSQQGQFNTNNDYYYNDYYYYHYAG